MREMHFVRLTVGYRLLNGKKKYEIMTLPQILLIQEYTGQ